MKIIDGIYYKRLERMRDEIRIYVEFNYRGKKSSGLFQNAGNVTEETKKGGVQQKFLSVPYSGNMGGFGTTSYSEKDAEAQWDEKKIESPAQIPPQHSSSFNGQSAKIEKTEDEVKIPGFFWKDKKYRKLDEVLEKKQETFSEMLLRLIDEKGLKDSDAYKRANIDRRLFSKIRGDKNYLPSKKTAISFCMALQLEMDEAKKLLATAGYALSSSSRFDLIIMYLIENSEYNIHFANIVLEDYGEGTLSKT